MKKKILVIEDDLTLLHMYKTMLENAGYLIESAENGQIGIEKIETFRPDLILLDILMPVMDGYEVLKRLKSEGEAGFITTLVLTSLNNDEEAKKAMLLGANDFIRKDEIHLTELLDKINYMMTHPIKA